MSGLKWSSLPQSYTKCLIVLFLLQTSQILGEDQDKFDTGYAWIHQNIRDQVPANAVQGGYEEDGNRIYVGRGVHKGDLLPAKVIPAYVRADVSYNHTVYNPKEIDILVCNSGKFDWVAANNGNVPPKAIAAGRTASGEILYAGRADYKGNRIVGKVQPSDKCVYISYGFVEMAFSAYEVLVYNSA